MVYQFWVTDTYYGGNISCIEQAAKEHGATLISVNGYALATYLGNREYVEGSREYIFLLETDLPEDCSSHEIATAHETAQQTVHFLVHERAVKLLLEKRRKQ